jgi:hypothetical protein
MDGGGRLMMHGEEEGGRHGWWWWKNRDGREGDWHPVGYLTEQG